MTLSVISVYIKNMLISLLIIVIGLIILFLLGPKESFKVQIREVELADNLDEYLKKSESQFPDIRPGTEKTIIWANPTQQNKTPLSIIYLHGFVASRQDIAPVCQRVAHKLGANLFYTRLTGHGRTSQAMADATLNDWLNDAVEALAIGRQLGEKVIVVGTSTGGTLATWLASHDDSDDVLTYILLSPNFGPKDSRTQMLNWPWAKYSIPLFFGRYWSYKPANPQQTHYWTIPYPTSSWFPMMGAIQLVRKSDLSQIKKAFLVLFSPTDQVVSVKKIEHIYSQLGSLSKKKVPIEDCQDPKKHIIAGDVLSPSNNERVTEIILDFIAQQTECH